MFDPQIHVRRRQRLVELMGERALAIVRAAPVRTRSRDTDFPFRQNSDFYYLTGFTEPDSICVIAPDCCTLFLRPRSKERETWGGRRLGSEDAPQHLGVDAAYPIDEFAGKLPEFAATVDRVFIGLEPLYDDLIGKILRWGRAARNREGLGAHAIEDLGRLVHEMRVIKDEVELACMERAAEISVAAMKEAMQICRPGLLEAELQAQIEYQFRRRGASGPAYESIVASGPNAATLHYVENNRRIGQGDLVLIDAGAEVGCYAADLSRTFPADGCFSGAQRDVYQVVLEAQSAAIEQCRAGNRLQEVHRAALRRLAIGMIELGLLEGDLDRVIESGDYKRFYMHGTSHWLGLDVHDVGQYKPGAESRRLEPGMAITVEPGLYVRPEQDDIPKELRGLGIRIEDDVIITADQPRILTANAPKTPEAIEKIVGLAR